MMDGQFEVLYEVFDRISHLLIQIAVHAVY